MKICPHCDKTIESFIAEGPVAIVRTKIFLNMDGKPSVPTSQIIKYISADEFMDTDLLIMTCPHCEQKYPINELQDVFICAFTGKRMQLSEAISTNNRGIYVSNEKYRGLVNRRVSWRN